MSMQTEKLEIIQMLLETKDRGILKQMRALFDKTHKGEDFWDEMPDKVKESAERGIRQSEAGEGIPHKEAVKKLTKWL